MYDELQRMMSLYKPIHDEMGSIAARLAKDQIAYKLTYQDSLAALNHLGDSQTYVRNLSDQIRMSTGNLVDAFQNAYRPEALARVDEMLAGFRFDTSIHSQFASAAAESLIDKQRFLTASQAIASSLAPLQDSYSRLSDLQRSLAAQYAGITSRLDELTPLLSAQSNWARTVHFPASLEEKRLFAAEAATLFDQISSLRSLLGTLPSDEGDEEEDRQAEQAIAVANERLASAFSEKSPTLTVRRIQDLLASALTGTFRLSPKATAVLLAILINLISNFLYDTTKAFLLAEPKTAPRVSKELKREVKKVRRTVSSLPGDLRVVVASELIVRQGPGQSTPAVGRLYGADLVWLIKARNRSWSLVEFQDEDGEVVLQGWVFSRYIQPLRGRVRQ
ncbi:MAG TPA: SH3 domain-containing protein [Thermoanaerobaculia bacterium]|jgi:hypothetical protein|nr:SH3 domain-containing protein [Thermoanaerobaculia bacterium]